MLPPRLSELFPDADFSFSMHLRPGDARGFFSRSPQHEMILAERRRWLKETPARCVAVEPDQDSGPLLRGLQAFARETAAAPAGLASSSLPAVLLELGHLWEPDFLIVKPDIQGRFALCAGCVCFPSSWALEEKIGLPVEAIHGVVPGLNRAIGNQIHKFLSRLKPGAGWVRSNWGISASAEPNQHPRRSVNRLPAGTDPASTWMRIEHQVLMRLPEGASVLFGIRLQSIALPTLREDRQIRPGLHRALATMPEAMVAYKNLTAVRPALLAYLNPGD